MKTYSGSLRCSNDGKSWNNLNTTVKVTTEAGAKLELRKKLKYENLIMIALGITPVAVLGLVFGNSRGKLMALIKEISPNYVNLLGQSQILWDLVFLIYFFLLTSNNFKKKYSSSG